MDLKTIQSRVKYIAIKYKYVIIIVAVGLALMLLPGRQENIDSKTEVIQTVSSSDPEAALENILSQISGAGRVEVMLTVLCGEKTIYQTDNDLSEDQNGQTNRSDTVILTGTDRYQNGLVTQVIPPVYQGAIVVCDGADDPVVRLRIVEAVSKSTGLGSDHISVLKMK